ncbi:MAG: electron transport complex subunit E [Deferribacteraceae bacterium]|jgi:electron transport complex protein RnfE|nr:electron transport complex subunit E [Deferribacteraceae bacterium]
MNIKNFTDGLIKNNAVFKQMLGLCPALAVTTTMLNGIAMGLATTAVLAGSNVVISALKSVIPNKVRIPAYIVVIATLVTMVDLLMNAYLHDLHKVLGLFIPLIVVNCIVLGRAESFASKNGIFASLLDGLGNGIGFTLGLAILAAVREILGSGTILGVSLSTPPIIVFILPPGAFLALGFLMAGYNRLFKGEI